jgi:pyruvate/2-oxoglutarate dehydrogenase complex dihydrolipoamide acyltransferase (E2) component
LASGTGAKPSGFIEERYFVEGQRVKTGDLLFRIEQATYKAAVEQQRANLAKAKATEVNAAMQLGRGKDLVRGQNIPQATVDQRAAGSAHGWLSSRNVLREFGRGHYHREFAIRSIAAEFPLQIENRGVNGGCSQRIFGSKRYRNLGIGLQTK